MKERFYFNKTEWLIISMILIVILASISTHSAFFDGWKWAEYAMIIPGLYVAGYVVVMFYYMIKNLFKKGGKID